MNKKFLWLRIAYWVGIIADAVVAILLWFPRLYTRFYNLNVVPDASFGLGLRRAAPLMMGWTVLLLWADRKPVERKGVLPITIAPVVGGYIAYLAAAALAGFVSFRQLVTSLIVEAVFTMLLLAGYLIAIDIENQAQNADKHT